MGLEGTPKLLPQCENLKKTNRANSVLEHTRMFESPRNVVEFGIIICHAIDNKIGLKDV